MDIEMEFLHELKLLGKRLKKLRKHRGLTLLDLEMLCGINDSDISRYENGKERIELFTLFRLAKALKISLNSLTDYNGDLPEDTYDFKPLLKKQKKIITQKKPKEKVHSIDKKANRK